MQLHTIMVVYILPDKHVSNPYAFNTEDEFQVGDILDSPRYSSFMRVVAVYERSYFFASVKTGELSNAKRDDNFKPIKTLRLNPYPHDILVNKIEPIRK